jgi:O-antigen ligase
MTGQLAIIAAAVVLFFVLVRMIGLPVTIVGTVIFTTCYLPIVALGDKDNSFSVGIANAFPEWRTYTLLFLSLGIICMLQWPRFLFNPAHALFIAWLAYGLLFVWSDTPPVYAGALQLMLGVLAWGVGAVVAQMERPKKFEKMLVIILAGTALFEALVSVLQSVGLPINQLGTKAGTGLGGRVSGTANHPNTLGKLMFPVLMLLLPFTESRVGKIARWALLGSAALFVPFGLAEGRANLAALVSALLIWAVLTPNSRFSSRRMALIPLTVVGIAATTATVAARFEEDPTGGVRGRLVQIATNAIPDHPWSGVGPNSYVTEISQYYDSFIPVHNALILLTAEVGLVGTFLFFAPVVAAVVRAVPKARTNPYARVLIATAPGWFAIAWTGWGLLGNSVLPLFMFAFSYTAARAKLKSADTHGPQGREDSRPTSDAEAGATVSP